MQDLLNSWPRNVPDFHTPHEKFRELVAKKGEAIANEPMLR